MQKIAVEKDGVRALVDADKLDAALAKSWSVVPEGEGEDPEPIARPEPRPSPTASDNAKAFATGASRWGSLGFDDTMSGLMAGGLEAVSPTSLSDEGDDFLTRLQKGYSQGKADRRALVDEMSDRAPTAYNAGAVTGALLPMALVRKVPEGLPRMLAGRTASTVGAVGISDADPLSMDGAEAAAKGWVFDAALGKMVPIAGAALSRVSEPIKRAATAAAEKSRGKVADVLDALVKAGGSPAEAAKKKAADLAKEASKRVRGAPPSPPESAPPPAEMAPPVDEGAFRTGLPSAKGSPADPLEDLVTARMPEPATAPAPAASQALPEQMTSIVPVVTRNSSAGNIAKAVEAKAIELGTTDLATIANALKLPTTVVADPLKNAVSRFAFREAVKGAGSKAPAVVDEMGMALDDLAKEARAPGAVTQPLDEASKRIIREAGSTTKNTNPVALDDVGGRAPKVVAAVGQQEKWRGIYDSLKSPEQRAAFIQQLRNESGLTDDTIRQRLKLTMAEWRRTSFTR